MICSPSGASAVGATPLFAAPERVISCARPQRLAGRTRRGGSDAAVDRLSGTVLHPRGAGPGLSVAKTNEEAPCISNHAVAGTFSFRSRDGPATPVSVPIGNKALSPNNLVCDKNAVAEEVFDLQADLQSSRHLVPVVPPTRKYQISNRALLVPYYRRYTHCRHTVYSVSLLSRRALCGSAWRGRNRSPRCVSSV